MSHQNIFSENTNKLKTKLYISSGLSLFAGLTKTLPTNLSVIGLNFEGNKKLWFILGEVKVINFSISAKSSTLISLASLVLNPFIIKLSLISGNSEF